MVIKGLAHITGGGFYDNIPRILPDELGVRIKKGAWPVLPIFQLIQNVGQVATEEMYHVFNMGIGLIAIISAEQAERALQSLGGDGYHLGEVIPIPENQTEENKQRVILE